MFDFAPAKIENRHDLCIVIVLRDLITKYLQEHDRERPIAAIFKSTACMHI